MTLREKQSLFAKLLARLIFQAEAMGFEVTLGDVFRDPRVHGKWGEKAGYGAAYSVHKMKLAADVNLFRDGRYLSSSESHRRLGEWWEEQHELCRWGGRFRDDAGRPTPDGNHYSLEHAGRK